MTPKEKAEQLLNRFYFDTTLNELEASKECALIAVDEIMKANPHSNPFNTDVYSTMDFWQKVKLEIEKL